MHSIYHITSRTAWTKALAEGVYHHPSLLAEGFIHCARVDQVSGVANALYRGKEDLVLVKIDSSKLDVEIQDDCTDSGVIYPHVYGAISMEAVDEVIELTPEIDGTFIWPLHATEPLPTTIDGASKGPDNGAPDLI